MTALLDQIASAHVELAQHRTFIQERVPNDVACEIAWAAGFIEGEGSFQWGRYPNRRKPTDDLSYGSPRVNASQQITEPLERLANLFGGSVRPIKPSPNQLGKKPMWKWEICGNDAIAVIIVIRPYLSSRRNEQINKIAKLWMKRLQRDREQAWLKNTYCAKGHLRSEHGGRQRTGKKQGQWYCRACMAEYDSRRFRRLKEATSECH